MRSGEVYSAMIGMRTPQPQNTSSEARLAAAVEVNGQIRIDLVVELARCLEAHA